jgi:hypothetical protein
MPSGMLYSVNLQMIKQAIWVKQSIGLLDYLALTKKPVLSFDTYVTLYQSTWYNISDALLWEPQILLSTVSDCRGAKLP